MSKALLFVDFGRQNSKNMSLMDAPVHSFQLYLGKLCYFYLLNILPIEKLPIECKVLTYNLKLDFVIYKLNAINTKFVFY